MSNPAIPVDAAGRVAPDVPARVFITGANGFIARALGERLRELGATVTGVDLQADPKRGVVEGSTIEPQEWAEALAGVDAVIHTAAIVSNAASLDDAWTVNVLGTRRTLAAAADAGVGRFLHLSSIMAFGFDYPDGVDETYPVRVCGHSYPDTRVNSEAVVLAAHAAGEIDCTIVRPGDVIGPGSVWVRESIRLAKAHQMVLPAGGNGVFTPTFIDNLVDGILLALTAEVAIGQIYTITDGLDLPAHEYFGRLTTLAGSRMTTLPTAVAVPLTSTLGAIVRRLGGRSELTAATMLMLSRRGGYSIQKAKDQLGFEPRVGFEDAMTACETWARAEGLV
jgi:nucleoside-diphosphate-sugar epimerase